MFSSNAIPSWFGAWTLMLDVSGWCMSTGSETFSQLIFLDATKCILLSIFTFTETNCQKIWGKLLTSNKKTATSGWPAWLKTSLLKLSVFASKGEGFPPYTSCMSSTVMYCYDFLFTGHDLWWGFKFWPFSVMMDLWLWNINFPVVKRCVMFSSCISRLGHFKCSKYNRFVRVEFRQ